MHEIDFWFGQGRELMVHNTRQEGGITSSCKRPAPVDC